MNLQELLTKILNSTGVLNLTPEERQRTISILKEFTSEVDEKLIKATEKELNKLKVENKHINEQVKTLETVKKEYDDNKEKFEKALKSEKELSTLKLKEKFKDKIQPTLFDDAFVLAGIESADDEATIEKKLDEIYKTKPFLAVVKPNDNNNNKPSFNKPAGTGSNANAGSASANGANAGGNAGGNAPLSAKDNYLNKLKENAGANPAYSKILELLNK